jgi:hypothetical protein
VKLTFLPLLTLGLLVTAARSAWPSEPHAEPAARKVAEAAGPRVTFNASIAGAPEPLRESPDGRIIVQGGRLYDKVAGQPLTGPLAQVDLRSKGKGGRKSSSWTVYWAFSPDGKLLVVGGAWKMEEYNQGNLEVYDVATGQVVARMGPQQRLGAVTYVAFGKEVPPGQGAYTVYYSAERYRPTGK